MFRGRTPLGWLQLTHSRSRFLVASAGVGFAVVLVFMQLGFMNMLFDTTVKLHQQLDADVVLMSVETDDVHGADPFSRRRLLQAAGVPGVRDIEGLYVANLGWKKPTDGSASQILMLAVRPDFAAFAPHEIASRLPQLSLGGSILFDRGARGDFADFLSAVDAGEMPELEINSVTVSALGTFSIGASFAIEAIGITSAETLFAIQPQRDPGAVSLGLIKLEPGADIATVVQAINAAVGPEVHAKPMTEFIDYSRSRLADESPIATVFTFGSIVGLAVGAIIVVQILSSDVQDHLGEYATFKAMGFTNRYLLGIVYEQSLILTFAGFLPALGLSLLLYSLVGSAVDMAMTMTGARIVSVFLLTGVMCALAGTIAMRRIYSADPAADEDYMQAYFGVSPAQSLASVAGLAPFSAEAGFKDVSLRLGMNFELTERWGLFATGTYTRLIGDAADSPITADANQFSAGIGLTYTFGRVD